VISHDRAQELISARMDAPLPPGEQRELQSHLVSCAVCREFAAESATLARSLDTLPSLAPSPRVSRAVMTAIQADDDGWAWLRRGLQVVSSPGMAVASAVALVVALSSALIIALNAPSDLPGGAAEGTIAAVAVAPLPTEIPTPTAIPEPTATRPPLRTVAPAAAPTETPVPRPTATSVPTVEVAAEPVIEPSLAPVYEEPTFVPVAEDPALAMAPAETASEPSADLAQAAAPEVAATGEEAPQAAPDGGQNGDGSRKRDGRRKEDPEAAPSDGGSEAAPQPVATEAAPIPDQAVAAMESAGSSGAVSLPPAPLMPMPPSQAFLPITPTPADQSTPAPEDTATQAEAPQVAEQPPADTIVEGERVKNREKRKKSKNGNDVYEWQQTAHVDQALGWSSQSLAEFQTMLEPQVTDEPVAETSETLPPDSGTSDSATDASAVSETSTDATTSDVAESSDTSEEPREIDPVTGYEIDPATGFLIDPNTGYLIDMATGRIIDPRTGYVVHPYTGLLIDPATGALLDPVTLEVVVPAGFGSDTPAYMPGDDAMRDQIEGVVDSTYDNATYKVEPATDGPVQPVGEIVVPTESGDSIEIGNPVG
jgi:hypothetical protein